MTNGILYIATGDRFAAEAVASVVHLRRHMPKIPTAIVTDDARDLGVHFDKVIVLDEPDFGYGDKPEGMLRTPFERTLFIDTDVYVHADVGHLFGLLARFDIATAQEPGRQSYETEDQAGIPASFPELNTGVVLYQKSATTLEFIEAWSQAYRKEREETGRNYRKRQGAWGYDQPSFRAMCYHRNIRLGILPQEYNFMPRWSLFLLPPVKIEHRTNRDRDHYRGELYRNSYSTELRTALLAVDTLKPNEFAPLLRTVVRRWGIFVKMAFCRILKRSVRIEK